MKQWTYLFLAVCLCGGCSFLKMQTAGEISYLEPTALTAAGAKVALQKEQPAAGCTFKGEIGGEVNPDVENRFLNLVELSPDMQADLRNNAAQMGGNTVWVRGVDWYNTETDAKYPTPSVINAVQYRAQVYWCPEK